MKYGYRTALGLLTVFAMITAGCAQNGAHKDSTTTSAADPAVETAPAGAGADPAAVQSTAAGAEAAAATSANGNPAAGTAPAAADPATIASAAPAPAPSAPAAPASSPAAAAPAAGAPASAAAAPVEDTAAVSKRELTAKLLAMPPQTITSTIQQMPKHPRVRWLSGSGQYAYYVGGEFNAEYNPTKKVFTIRGDGAPVSCEYNTNGELVNNKKSDQNMKAECNELVSKLSDYLSR